MLPLPVTVSPITLTLCQGETAKRAAQAVTGMGMNKFAGDAPVLIVVSEEDYVKSAAYGARLKKNDYRSMDIGIAAAYLTAEAHTQGLGTCILGWLDDAALRSICGLTQPVRLVIALGYPRDTDTLRDKKRKALSELVTWLD